MPSSHTDVFSRTADFAHPERNVANFGIDRGMKIADFGAGSGAYVAAIAASLNNTGAVYAVDIQKDLLRRITNESNRAGYTNVHVVWADLEKKQSTGIADEHLDLVLISNLLFQVSDKIPPLQEARRILKPRGKLVVIDWSESFGGLGPKPEDVITREKIEECAKSTGFTFLHEIPVGAHHFGLLFRPTQ